MNENDEDITKLKSVEEFFNNIRQFSLAEHNKP